VMNLETILLWGAGYFAGALFWEGGYCFFCCKLAPLLKPPLAFFDWSLRTTPLNFISSSYRLVSSLSNYIFCPLSSARWTFPYDCSALISFSLISANLLTSSVILVLSIFVV
jgi:hypothetical protein